jgi:sugar phosphate isomerase/epimerase
MTGRLLRGEGAVDFAAVLAALDASDAEPVVATEVFNPALVTTHGPLAAAKAMKTAADRVHPRTGSALGGSHQM